MDDVEQSLLGNLTNTEKYLIKTQELMWIRGKRGKRVPVLIPPETTVALNYIVDAEVRRLAGLKETNKYIFATRGDGVISASQSICELGQENAGDLIHPDRLTSTGYRAYMATIAQCLGLKDHQIQWLCTHLGHTENVHKTHYRFALDGIERVQLGKLLLLQDKNLLHKYRDTKLEDIEFQDIISSVDGKDSSSTNLGEAPEAIDVGDAELDMDDVAESDVVAEMDPLATSKKKQVPADKQTTSRGNPSHQVPYQKDLKDFTYSTLPRRRINSQKQEKKKGWFIFGGKKSKR